MLAWRAALGIEYEQNTVNRPAPETVGGSGGGISVNGGSAEILGNWIMGNVWPTGGGVAIDGTGTSSAPTASSTTGLPRAEGEACFSRDPPTPPLFRT